MKLYVENLLGINITLSSRETILEYIKKFLIEATKKPRKPFIIVTPNSEQIVFARHDTEFKRILNQADVAIPDGFPVARLLNILRIPGVEFMEDLVAMAAKEGYRIGLIGGRADLAIKALACLQKKYQRLEGWAIEPESFNLTDVIRKIQVTDVKIVFVGLGAPKQEFYIDTISKQCPIVLMSVGGSFDIIAGKIQRAPMFIRSIGFEWAWRLVKEPWRWRRQVALVKFVWLVVRHRRMV
ncbi:MAG: WecB/TagA/CpsF family glycosyltransferase [Patescibacteria group bacterium]